MKLMQIKELATAYDNFTRANQQELTKAQNELASQSATGKKVLMRDYNLLKQHKVMPYKLVTNYYRIF